MKKEENLLKNWLINFKNTDYFFLELTLALVLIGLIFAITSSTHESFRLTNNFLTLGLKQLVAFVIGLFLLVFFWSVNYKFWYHATWYLTVPTFIIMLITAFSSLGKSSGGSSRWLDLGMFQFQPAEIAKLSVILLISRFLTSHKWNEFKSYYYFAVCFALIFIIFKQPDLGSAGLLVIVLFQMLFLFNYPVWILLPLVLTTALLAFTKIMSTPYQLARIASWLHPELDPQKTGYNSIQAKYALAFGGLFGAGLGNSIQKQGNLPIPHSDFIFSVIAEEIGFLGVTAILILYITWIIRGFFLVSRVKEKFGLILGNGIILLIGTQAVINILVAVGLLPVTGVTLPFFSCGGTSLIVSLGMCGILFNIIGNRIPNKSLST